MESGGDYLGDPKSMEEIQRDLINKFDCNPEWPICMFDFTYKNKVPTSFCFKMENNLSSYCHENYFNSHDESGTAPAKRPFSSPRSLSETLIERNNHICLSTPTTDFVKNFKSMFLSEHYIFFKSNIFNFSINNHADIKEKLNRFVAAILWYSSPEEETKEPEA